MPRPKGAKNIRIKDLLKISKTLKQRAEKKSPRWEQIVTDTGMTVELIGRMLHGRGRQYPKAWSQNEYAYFVNTLRDCADVIEMRAKED